MTIIKIRVKTNSKTFKITDIGDYLLVEVTSPAKDNKANIEIVKGLKKHFGKDVEIVKGFKSKEKIIKILDS